MVGERATDGAYTWALKTHASVSLRRFLAYLRHGSVNELSWVYSLVRAAWSLFRATRWLGRAPLPLCQQEEEGGGRGPWKQLISRNAVSARCEQLHRNVFNVSNHRSNYRTDAFTFPTLPCLGMNIIIQLSSLARLINWNRCCFFQGRDLSSVLKGVEEGLVFLRFLRFLSVRGGEGKNIDCPGAEENYRALISEALIRKDRDKRRKFLSKLSPFRHPPRDGNFYAIFRLPSRQAHPLSHPPLKG